MHPLRLDLCQFARKGRCPGLYLLTRKTRSDHAQSQPLHQIQSSSRRELYPQGLLTAILRGPKPLVFPPLGRPTTDVSHSDAQSVFCESAPSASFRIWVHERLVLQPSSKIVAPRSSNKGPFAVANSFTITSLVLSRESLSLGPRYEMCIMDRAVCSS